MNTTNASSILAALVLSLAAACAPADAAPENKTNAIQYARSGSQVSTECYLATSGATHMFRLDAAESVEEPAGARTDDVLPLCFPWGEMVTVDAFGQAAVVWTLSATVTLGAQNSDRALWILDDYGPDGAASGHPFGPQGGTWTMGPDFDTLTTPTHPGYRSGLCSHAQDKDKVLAFWGNAYSPRNPFCDTDEDCVEAGAGDGAECVKAADTGVHGALHFFGMLLADAMKARGCAMAVTRAASTTLVCMGPER